MINFFLFSFLQLQNIRGTYSKYFKTIFPKLIFHLRFSDQLPYVLLQEFYIHSTYVTWKTYFYKIYILDKKISAYY